MNKLLQKYKKIIVLDVETSGLNFINDKIIEFAYIVMFKNKQNSIETTANKFFIKIADNEKFDPKITELTRISEEILARAGIERCDAEKKIVDELYLSNCLIVGYNLQFDINFLYQMLLKRNQAQLFYNCDYLDLLTVVKDRNPYPHKLSNAVKYYGICIKDSHEAMADTMATYELLIKINDEKSDLINYINLFGYAPKYDVNGIRFRNINYIPQECCKNKPLYGFVNEPQRGEINDNRIYEKSDVTNREKGEIIKKSLNEVFSFQNNIPGKLNLSIFEFIAGIYAEYAISALGYNESDKLYQTIKSYYFDTTISADGLIKELRSDENMTLLFDCFPKDKKDLKSWENMKNEFMWTSNAEKNIYTYRDKSIETTKLFNSLTSYSGQNLAMKYCFEKGEGIFKSLGEGNIIENISTPHKWFIAANNFITKNNQVSMTDEDFFISDESIIETDDEQRNAIKAEMDKNLLVLAGAGSGKTRVLVSRLAYLHLVKGIPLNKMVLLTFTNDAANGMRTKSENLIKSVYSQYAPEKKPFVNARTIDSFFKRVLESNWALIGFERVPELYLDSDEKTKEQKLDMIYNLIVENKLQGIFEPYICKKENCENTSIREELLRRLEDYASGVVSNVRGLDSLFGLFLNKQLSSNQVMGFSYINAIVRDALRNGSGLKEILLEQYKCILIDEFQDINILQNSVFSELYDTEMHFTLVGDDDQSIYYWRGASSNIIGNLLNEQTCNVSYLLINYRNNPHIIKAGAAILRLVDDRAKVNKSIVARRKNGAKIRVSESSLSYLNVANEIERLLRNDYKDSDIAVLCRIKDDCDKITSALTAANIRVDYSSPILELSDAYKLAKAITNILNENKLVESCKEIKRIVGESKIGDRKIIKILKGGLKFEGNNETNNSKCNFADVVEIANTLRNSHLIGMADAIAVINEAFLKWHGLSPVGGNNKDVLLSLEEFCKNNSAPWPIKKKQISEIYNMFEEQNVKSNNKFGIRTYASGVKVATIHGAKGLEYKAVFILGLNLGDYPNLNRIQNKYNEQEKALENLGNSKTEYFKLKNSISSTGIDILLAECKNKIFNEHESSKMQEFYDIFKSNFVNIMSLSADGVELYTDIYCQYILPLIREYQVKISDCEFIMKERKEKIDSLEEEKLAITDENQEQIDEKENDILKLKQEVIIEEGKKKLTLSQLDLFNQHIKTIKRFYAVCTNAKGFIYDIEKFADIDILRQEVLNQKKMQENEERKTFYVAITRAIDYLYLYYASGKRESEFITQIPQDCRTQYLTMTKEEEKEVNRIKSALSEICTKEKINDERHSSLVDKLVGLNNLAPFVKKGVEDFFAVNPIYELLTEKAKDYFKKAISLLCISEITSVKFETEYAHNMQRCVEVYLEEMAGDSAIPVRVNRSLAKTIARQIRKATSTCLTHAPNEEWLVKLLSNGNKFVDGLKQLGVMHYIVRSSKWEIDEKITDSWGNTQMECDAEQFLRAVIDISNMRNKMIHNDDRNIYSWSSDLVAKFQEYIELVIKSFGNTVIKNTKVSQLSRVTLKKGQKVEHNLFGLGTIESVHPYSSNFSVIFSGNGYKTFDFNHGMSKFVLK